MVGQTGNYPRLLRPWNACRLRLVVKLRLATQRGRKRREHAWLKDNPKTLPVAIPYPDFRLSDLQAAVVCSLAFPRLGCLQIWDLEAALYPFAI